MLRYILQNLTNFQNPAYGHYKDFVNANEFIQNEFSFINSIY